MEAGTLILFVGIIVAVRIIGGAIFSGLSKIANAIEGFEKQKL